MFFTCSWSNTDLEDNHVPPMFTDLPLDNVLDLAKILETLLRTLKQNGYNTSFNGTMIRLSKNDIQCDFQTEGLTLRYPLCHSADKELKIFNNSSRILERLESVSLNDGCNPMQSFIDTLQDNEKFELAAMLSPLEYSDQSLEHLCEQLQHLFELKTDTLRAKSIYERVKSNIWHYYIAKCLNSIQINCNYKKKDTMEYFITYFAGATGRQLDKSYLSKIWLRGWRLISIARVAGNGILYSPEVITAGVASEVRNFDDLLKMIASSPSLSEKLKAPLLSSTALRTSPLRTSPNCETESMPTAGSCNASATQSTIKTLIDMDKLEALIKERCRPSSSTSELEKTQLQVSPGYFNELKTTLMRTYGKSPTMASLKKKTTHKTLFHLRSLALLMNSINDNTKYDYCFNYFSKLKKTYESKYKLAL